MFTSKYLIEIVFLKYNNFVIYINYVKGMISKANKNNRNCFKFFYKVICRRLQMIVLVKLKKNRTSTPPLSTVYTNRYIMSFKNITLLSKQKYYD